MLPACSRRLSLRAVRGVEGVYLAERKQSRRAGGASAGDNAGKRRKG